MTLEEIRALEDRQLDCKLAKVFGFVDIEWSEWMSDWKGTLPEGFTLHIPSGGTTQRMTIPDFSENLNMLQKFEATLTPEQWGRYITQLGKANKTVSIESIPNGLTANMWSRYCLLKQPARQRAEALLFVLTQPKEECS